MRAPVLLWMCFTNRLDTWASYVPTVSNMVFVSPYDWPFCFAFGCCFTFYCIEFVCIYRIVTILELFFIRGMLVGWNVQGE